MSVDLAQEKARKLTTQDIYDIINFSTQAAEDNGFMNSFIFQRALYLFAAIVLIPERKEEIAPMVARNINEAWDSLIEDGTIEQLIQDYDADMFMLADCGQNWYDEYTAYAHSARGLLDTIQTFTGDIVQAAAEQLKNASVESGIQDVLTIADKWGMNNELGKETTSSNVITVDPNSLFQE